MARKPAASRGSINAVLNRLVREAVITEFRTNLDDRQAMDVQVVVIANVGAEERREAIRHHVTRELEALGLSVTVTVRSPA